jgi:competence protein ComEA
MSQTASGPLDLNSATLDQLKSLPGMGEVYARRVIAGRPYSAKNQLVTRGIIPQTAYEKMQALVVARRPRNK